MPLKMCTLSKDEKKSFIWLFSSFGLMNLCLDATWTNFATIFSQKFRMEYFWEFYRYFIKAYKLTNPFLSFQIDLLGFSIRIKSRTLLNKKHIVTKLLLNNKCQKNYIIRQLRFQILRIVEQSFSEDPLKCQ